MKKIKAILLLLPLLLCACEPQQPDLTATPEPPITPGNTEAVATEPAVTQPALSSPYGDGKGVEMLTGIDTFGRMVPLTAGQKDGKEVGMMYWIWHGQDGLTPEIVDTTKIIEEYGLDYALYHMPEYNPNNVSRWWGEPVFGYYHSEDEYIIRKHLTMLMYAGVDFIVFDGTNRLTYPRVVRKICDVVCEMRSEGFMVPQIAYFTHTCSLDTVRQAYQEIYRFEKYRPAWYCIEGKPLIIAYTDAARDKARSGGQHNFLHDYDPAPLSEELLNFFYFRTPAWCGMDPVTADGWPWVDWAFPPPLYGNLMSVSCASHNYCMFSWAAMKGIYPADKIPTEIWNGGRTSWGRGYSFKDHQNNSERALEGSFYQEQWDYIIKRSPDLVFIDGWNEWTCGAGIREDYGGVSESYDSFNEEFSRDAEPMRGGHEDAFLIQTAINARNYQYHLLQEAAPAVHKTIDLQAGTSQWSDVDAVYFCTGSKNYGRDFKGATNNRTTSYYTTPAAANSLQEVRITCDAENIYLMIRTDGNMVLSAENHMNVLIGTGTPERKGWESYEYILNRSRDGGKLSVEKLSEGFATESVGEAAYTVQGETLQIAVPRAMLGMSAEDDRFYFKVADSVEHPEDILDYYVTGRCMPMGRFSYQYLG